MSDLILYLKNDELQTLTHKLTLVYLLNIADLILGMILFKANFEPMMNEWSQFLFSSPWAIVLIKIMLPAGMIGYLFYHIKKTNDRRILRLINLLTLTILFFFLISNLLHLSNWINTVAIA